MDREREEAPVIELGVASEETRGEFGEIPDDALGLGRTGLTDD